MIVDNQGMTRVLTSRWPVTEIIGAQYTSAIVAGPTWNPIPLNGLFIENALTIQSGVSIESAAGPSAIRIVPGYANWLQGRNYYRLQITYVNGWAHAGIISSVSLGATEVAVDDCTGMTDGTIGRGMWIYDGAATEYVQIASTSVSSGPGIATLKTPLLYSHNASTQQPVIISALPESVQEAAILHATYQALTRGATATTVQNMPGSVVSQSASNATILDSVKDILKPYRRVI